MILIKYVLESDTRGKVYYIHKKPQDLPNSVKADGILVNAIPEPVNYTDKIATLYINPQTKELWYEYTDKPPTPEELIQEQIDTLALEILKIQGVI